MKVQEDRSVTGDPSADVAAAAEAAEPTDAEWAAAGLLVARTTLPTRPALPPRPAPSPNALRRLREMTGWVALPAATDDRGVRRGRYVNLGPGAIYQVTAMVYPAPPAGEPDSSVAGLYHPAGVQYLDGPEARQLVAYLDVIAER